MPLIGRSDGTYVRDAPVLRRVMPHLMPTRAGATIYFDQRLDVSRTLRFLEERNAGRDASERITLFHVVLTAIVRTIGARPQMNRFVVGRRLYQRHDISLSFVVKKRMADDAPMTTVKVVFDPNDTLEGVVARVRGAVKEGRSDRPNASEKEMSIVTRLPRSGLRALVWLQRVLDYFNLLPYSLTKNDPLYASMFLANLGSVGLEAAYHHLYEYGTIPLFGVVGRVEKAPWVDERGDLVVRDVLPMRYTFDERIADGFYCARSLELFKKWVEDPVVLTEAPVTDGAP